MPALEDWLYDIDAEMDRAPSVWIDGVRYVRDDWARSIVEQRNGLLGVVAGLKKRER